MTEDVKAFIQKCQICTRCKRLNIGPPHISVHKVPDTSWEIIAMDETSTVTKSNGFDCIWVFVDRLTKMAHFIPAVKEGLTSVKLANLFFEHIYKLHGLPYKIISDRDPRMNNEFWQQVLKRAGIKSNMSTAGRAQTDGQSEVTVRACIDMLRSFVNSNRDDWHDYVAAVEFAYNDTVHSSTGYTPFEMNYGKHPRGINKILFDSIAKDRINDNTSAVDLWKKLINITTKARENMEKVNSKMIQNNPGKRKETFTRGDQVLIHKDYAGNNVSQEKLANLYVGPFTVLRQCGEHAYLLSLPPAMDIDPVLNIRALKRFPEDLHEKDSENETGIRLENLPRLQNGEIVLQNVYITKEGNIHQLTGKVNDKEYTFLELIRRGHFDECANFMLDNFWKIKPPSVVGRIFRKTFDIGKFEGLIVAWDPQNDKKYEVAYCDGDSEWITEEQIRKKGSLQKKPSKVHMIYNAIRKDTVKVLVLCSGTKSVEDALYQRFHNVIETTGIDINPIFCPDICVDICKWDYKSSYPKNYFDVIWASPDCSQYSKSHTIGERQIEKADNLVLSCLEIIKYFNPHVWVIENSDGALKTTPFMKGWNNYKMKCSYCCYGFCYQKHTNICNNAQITLKMCSA